MHTMRYRLRHMSKFHRIMMYISILSISMITASGYAISPALPAINRTFTKVPTSVVNSLATVQQMVVLFAVFLAVVIAKKIGMKRTILWGVGILTISGIIPMFTSNFDIIMISRLGLGLGVGLFNSLAISIINLYFQGHERLRLNLLGFRTAVESFGHCILNFGAGLLLIINWHVTFLVYLAGAPIFILFWRYVPDIRRKAMEQVAVHKVKKTAKKNPLIHFSRKLTMFVSVSLCSLLFVIVMCNTAISIEVPGMVENMHLGNGTFASMIISFNTFAAGIISMFFGKVVRMAHHYTLALGIAGTTLGCIFMFLGYDAVMLSIGSILCGIAYPLSGTYAYALTGKLIPKKSESYVISWTLAVGCISAYTCPFVITGLGKFAKLFISGNEMNLAFLMLFIVSIITTITVISYVAHKNKQLQVAKAQM